MQLFKEVLIDLNLIALPFLTAVAYALLFFENTSGVPVEFRWLGLTHPKIFYLTLISAALALYGFFLHLSKKGVKKIIFVAPLFLTLIGLFIYTRDHPLFRLLVKDDHLVEYTQFFLLLGCSYFSCMISRFWRQKERILSILFLLAAILCFFVAGEEISWGQRLLGIETPEIIAETNLQDEITLHNHEKIFGYVYRGYMIIGLIGSAGWILLRTFKYKLSKKAKKLLFNITPDWYLSPYFAVAFFYNWDRFYLRPRTGEALWEEPMELLLILGITIFLMIKYARINGFKIENNAA